jgi:peroxiredoxin
MAADRRAPAFSLKDLHGATVTLDSLRGKVVVLNFWTKTCGPCLEEMPDLAELAKIVRDRPDVAVIAVSVDQGPEDVKATLQTALREPPTFDILFDPDSDIVGGKYGTILFPETWFIDKRGVIRARFDGLVTGRTRSSSTTSTRSVTASSATSRSTERPWPEMPQPSATR